MSPKQIHEGTFRDIESHHNLGLCQVVLVSRGWVILRTLREDLEADRLEIHISEFCQRFIPIAAPSPI